MDQSGQTYSNHTRWFPPFHFFVLPVLLINVFVMGWLLYRNPSRLGLWQLIVAVALVMASLTARLMVLAALRWIAPAPAPAGTCPTASPCRPS